MSTKTESISPNDEKYPKEDELIVEVGEEGNGKSKIKYKKMINELLGEGGFGEVYKFKSENGDIVAGKILDKLKLQQKSDNNLNFIKEEIDLQKSFDRPDIVKVINYVEKDQYIYIFLELCRGSLDKLIKKLKDNDKKQFLSEKVVQNIMIQLIIALNHLHSHNIIHRDLKLDNILLGKNLEVKIGDFGLAKKLTAKNRHLQKRVGTTLFCAPEVLNEKEYSFGVDIWSLGIIMCYLLTGKHPFDRENLPIYEIVNNIKEDNIPPIICGKISKAAESLIIQLLEKDAKKRPCLNQIIYHDFFNREGIPKYLGDLINIKESAGELLSIGNFCEDIINIGEFPDDILNKEVIFKDLKSIVRPIINKDIRYDTILIDEIKINNIKDIDIYVTSYLNNYDKFGVGYILSNGDTGVFYRDKSIILLNKDKNNFIYMNKEGITAKFSREKYPDKLHNKIKILNAFINYFQKNKKYDNQLLFNRIGKNEKESDIYVKDVVIDEKCIILKLSNEIEHIFFSDKVEMILSQNENIFTYINKDKNKINMKYKEITDNPCIELQKRTQYIRYANVNFLSQKLNKHNHYKQK